MKIVDDEKQFQYDGEDKYAIAINCQPYIKFVSNANNAVELHNMMCSFLAGAIHGLFEAGLDESEIRKSIDDITDTILTAKPLLDELTVNYDNEIIDDDYYDSAEKEERRLAEEMEEFTDDEEMEEPIDDEEIDECEDNSGEKEESGSNEIDDEIPF